MSQRKGHCEKSQKASPTSFTLFFFYKKAEGGYGHYHAPRVVRTEKLQNAHLLAKIGFNTAENEPAKVWQTYM